MTALIPVTVALDWTPNTTHIGLFVAQALGAYRAAGLELRWTTPEDDGYTLTPAVKVARGLADLGLAPSETLLSFALQPDKPPLRAVATLLQQDMSAIAVPAAGPHHRPADLDGALYASYSARFEGAIVRALLRADGGRGELREVTPARLSAPEMLDAGEADATWIFSHWEGVRAARRGRPLRQFRLGDWGLPYGHSPVLLARQSFIDAQAPRLRAFLAATAQGWAVAAHEPERAVDLMRQAAPHPTLADRDFLVDSARALAPAILDASGRWGRMDPERWRAFARWLATLGVFAGETEDVSAWSHDGLLDG